ncbi:hypothetical protein [Pleomorphomonas koreensis]|uniref:hypothetical protein n=1 Tax=Pleomorphomonas koreensis TaxID=257440 RepID=UPI0004144528|nr:hypothetical protein [Pleomorphomonas koreensis]
MRDEAENCRDALGESRALVAGMAGPLPELAVRVIDRLAPVIVDLIDSEPEATCPHCLAMILEKMVASPALAVLMRGFKTSERGEALRSIVEIKASALGFDCRDVTDEARSIDLSGGLH